MTIKLATWLLCGLASSALVGPANAQTFAAADDPAVNLGEVVVTARKRTEVLQDVPLSISAVGEVELERRNIQDVGGLYAQVPGLFTAPGSVSSTSDLAYLTMRGVGFNAGLEPAVGVFIDGMYQPQIGFDTAFLDLERVEVLRGPQGTLFGRNTQGGAINMITRKPGDTLQGRIAADVAEFDTFRLNAAIDGPVADTLSAGLSAGYARSDGFIYNTVLNQHQDDYEQSAVRGVLRWSPTDRLEAVLVADASEKDYNEVVRGVRLAGDHDESLIDQDRPDSKANHAIQLNITADVSESLTFTSITGYRYSESDNLLDMESRPSLGGTAVLPGYAPLNDGPVTVQGATLAAQVDQGFWSQEFRLEGEREALNWLVGAYYFEQHQNQSRQRQVGPGAAATIPSALYIHEKFEDERQGYAAFGQASYRPTERLELTLGARYSEEKVDGTGLKVSVFGAPVNRTAPLPRDGHDTFDNVSWMGSASYEITPDVSVYATYAQGWKAGGVDRYPGRVDNLVYRPENSDNYEIGLKSLFADRRVTLNLAAYHIDIENQQLGNVIPDPRGGPVPISVIEDAARSHVDGAEGELFVRPNRDLSFSATVSYSDGRFDEFVRRFTPTDTFDMAGTPFENVPKLTGSASVNWGRDLADGKRVEMFAEYRYVDDIIFQDNTRLSRARDQLTAPAYDRVNASASLILPGSLRVTAYVNNLFDSFDYNYISSDPFTGGDVFVVPLAPRQVGIRAARRF